MHCQGFDIGISIENNKARECGIGIVKNLLISKPINHTDDLDQSFVSFYCHGIRMFVYLKNIGSSTATSWLKEGEEI